MLYTDINHTVLCAPHEYTLRVYNISFIHTGAEDAGAKSQTTGARAVTDGRKMIDGLPGLDGEREILVVDRDC